MSTPNKKQGSNALHYGSLVLYFDAVDIKYMGDKVYMYFESIDTEQDAVVVAELLIDTDMRIIAQ